MVEALTTNPEGPKHMALPSMVVAAKFMVSVDPSTRSTLWVIGISITPAALNGLIPDASVDLARKGDC